MVPPVRECSLKKKEKSELGEGCALRSPPAGQSGLVAHTLTHVPWGGAIESMAVHGLTYVRKVGHRSDTAEWPATQPA